MRLLALFFVLAGGAFPQAEILENEVARKKLSAVPGLEVSLWAADPQLSNPVSISIDERGRIFVAECHRRHTSTLDIHMRLEWLDDDLACRRHEDQVAYHERRLGDRAKEWRVESERIRLLEDRSGAGRADHAVTFSDGYHNLCEGIGAGIIARNGEVWYSCIPNLWYLKATLGDEQANVRKALHTGFGVHLGASGHDFHGLRFGPDGKLYMSHGDRGFHVETDGKVVSFPDGGGVLRCNPDGSELEIVCVGLRNPQELAFDQYGNLFTGDNNISIAPDVGETCRWTYVVEGADYGWRIGYQFMPQGGAWCQEDQWKLEAGFQVPCVARLGHGPSGVTFHPGVAAIPERFRNHFFMCDYPGGVWAFEMRPKGASFEMIGLEKFLWELQAPDAEFGPDGAMYVADWVGMWDKADKGRIWRLAEPARLKDPAVLEVKTLLQDGMSDRSVDALSKLLDHADQRVRQAAQFELSARKASGALSRATDAARTQLGRIHAIWGLGQLKAPEPLLPLLDDPDPEVRAQAAKVLGSLKARVAFDKLVSLLRDESPRVRFFAALGLGKIGNRDALGPVIAYLRANNAEDRMLQHAGIMALLGIGTAEDLVTSGSDPSSAVRMAALVALRKRGRPEVALFLRDPDPKLVLEAARAVYDTPIPEAFPALVELLGRPAPERALVRAVNAAFHLGKAEELAAFASTLGAPVAAQVEALRVLGNWGRPAGRDRLMGLWRPIPPRPPQQAAKALSGALGRLLKGGASEVALEAARQAVTLTPDGVGDVMRNSFEDPATAEPVRAALLGALGQVHEPGFAGLLSRALGDGQEAVVREAVRLVPRTTGTSAETLLVPLVGEGRWRSVRQEAVAALGEGGFDSALGKLLDQGVPPELLLDLLEVAAGRPSLREKAATVRSSLPPYAECLEGGDAVAGRRAFFERSDVQCARCHQVGSEGGTVGPPLSKIGGQKTREYLLESIVSPNKQIAEGWGQVAVRLASEAVEVGRVERETDRTLTLIRADGKRLAIAKSEIKARKPALSAMPEDIAKSLSRRDLRDLVEYLSSLK